MIIDSLTNASCYYGAHKDFKEVFEFMSKITPDTEDGKYVLREGDVWVNISRMPATDAEDKSVFEAHEKFIDIQLVYEGSEIFGYSNVDRLEVKKPYSEAADFALLTGDIHKFVLKAGDFCVLFPQDAHVPTLRMLSENGMMRAVAKIRV